MPVSVPRSRATAPEGLQTPLLTHGRFAGASAHYSPHSCVCSFVSVDFMQAGRKSGRADTIGLEGTVSDCSYLDRVQTEAVYLKVLRAE